MRSTRIVVPVLLAVFLSLVVGCGKGDPVKKTLEERARWKVDVLGFLVQDDGRSVIECRIMGPVHSDLETLTVRVETLDASGNVAGTTWHAFDVSDIQRGAPTDRSFVIPEGQAPTESIRLDRVLEPTFSDYKNIPELARVAP